ncbi:MAG: sulfite exporter TauE/SafE family protein [Proteobacteria bacterium]|nr:sulfite exporter TauE/SafE family protein [Pseudomonadota bacterium]
MTADHWLLISAAVLAAAFVQGSTGVGFALIAGPVMGLIAPQLLPVSLLVLMLPLNLYVLWRERAAIDRHGASWVTFGRVAGTAGGIWVLAMLSASQLALFVGLATVAAALVTIAMPSFTPGRKVYAAAGVITGITETATGIGGPPLALVYQHQPVAVMRATIALCFLVGELVSLAVLVATDRVPEGQWQALAALLPALGVGAWLSRHGAHRVNERFLRRFVLGFAIVSGMALLVKAA